MRIRRAVEADRPAIARLHAAGWADSYRSILPDSLLDDRLPALISERWARRAIGPSDAVLVAGRGTNILGEAKDLYGTPVANERIEWDDLGVLRVGAAPRGQGRLSFRAPVRSAAAPGCGSAHRG